MYHRTLLALDFLYTAKDMSHLIKVIKDLGKQLVIIALILGSIKHCYPLSETDPINRTL